jgi:hypothetical protein
LDTDRTNGKADENTRLTSANDDDFELRFAPVRWLELNKGATRVKRGHERTKPDELWQGDAFDRTQPDEDAVPVYVRLGSGGALVAELVCGCLARALGLPAPEVFVVTIGPGMLPRSKLADAKTETICVGTRDLGGKTFTQMLNSKDDDAAVRMLHQWPELSRVTAFDEWTANPDRNMGNLIYAAQTLHIIDHADAFGGRGRDLYPLAELTAQAFTNKLGEMLNCFDLSHRSALLNDIHQWIKLKAAQLSLPDVVKNAGTQPWNSSTQDQELVDFLKQRLTLTHSLLCQRLGHPQLSLQAQHP